ncbi:MAG: hypothetical protein J5741_03025 [Bacteroidales bacterium]|nr:hypothetical protein [Bacteroidales bacterium]
MKNKTFRKRVIVSFAIAFFLVIADYWIQNITFPLFDDENLLAWVDQLLGTNKEYFDENDVTYINLGKDKELITITDDWGDTIGNDVITDRNTILRFLKLAENSGYSCIFLDVRFEKGYNSPNDSALFEQLRKMPRLILPAHREGEESEFIDSSLRAKMAYADYRSTIFSGFSRYEYLQDNQQSVALRMWSILENRNIIKTWYGYSCGHCKPCYNLCYIPLPEYLHLSTENEDPENPSMEHIRYPYAGSMILNPQRIPEKDVIDNLLKNKIVVLGDFDNDLHDSYIGEVPGPVLSVAAYKYLSAGRNKVDWIYVSFLFVLFFICSYFILARRHISKLFKEGSFLRFLLSFVSIGILFFFLKVFLYKFFLISMIMILPTVIFHILGNLDNYRTFFSYFKKGFAYSKDKLLNRFHKDKKQLSNDK